MHAPNGVGGALAPGSSLHRGGGSQGVLGLDMAVAKDWTTARVKVTVGNQFQIYFTGKTLALGWATSQLKGVTKMPLKTWHCGSNITITFSVLIPAVSSPPLSSHHFLSLLLYLLMCWLLFETLGPQGFPGS